MQLYLDIGNSRIKWALAYLNAPLGTWQRHGVCNSISDLTHSVLSTPWYASPSGSTPLLAIWYANVASDDTTAELEEFCKHLAEQPRLHRATVPRMQSGLHNAYESEKLGIDRWLAALAARHIFPNTHLLIVNMGTATTIDVVSAEGLFLGGCILPGLITMLASLGQATAQLPQISSINIETWPQKKTIATNTLDAIQIGCIDAQIGAINICRERASQVLTQTPLCLLTGGASKFIEDQLMYPVQKVDHLVLQGLQLSAKTAPLEK
jgi:type III pantothenate kinase